ncbi:hypothetical protein B7Z17_02165 [Candidatus Saccharibacteria bacterium 32-49-10]|nr:MAG: hypothetical protein B7Z17_02165 [Candidatus Saccharibacteria bacterium 32-49-10]
MLKNHLTNRPVVVIPNAPQDLSDHLKKPIDLTEPPRNLIYMGSFMRYKNVEALIAGMEFLPEYTLHLLSRITPKRKAELTARIPKGAKVVFHSGVSDEKYAQLLADRAIMVSGSRDEGYGLPLVEALKLGVPAVVSDLPIFHEVAGDGALYFPCNNPQMFAEEVKTLDDQAVREYVVENGTAHIEQFNWKQSAQTLLDAAHKL